MNPNASSPSPRAAGAAQETGAVPKPTSGRENSGLMYFFIGAATLALLVVLGFNLLGPEGASRTGVGDGPAQAPAGQTIGGPNPRSDAAGAGAGAGTTGAEQGGSASPSVNATVPQAPDSPTPPGREGVGAPMGGAPQAGQAQPQGMSGDGAPSTGGTPPMAAQTPASAIPAAPPAANR